MEGKRAVMTLYCKQCEEPIKFSDEYVSERTGKKIPLDLDTDEPHDCPVRRDQPQTQLQGQEQTQQMQQQRRYLQCNKGCGEEIYFDQNKRTESGKWIPLDKQTGLPHQCQ